jgi:hypothetical protein
MIYPAYIHTRTRTRTRPAHTRTHHARIYIYIHRTRPTLTCSTRTRTHPHHVRALFICPLYTHPHASHRTHAPPRTCTPRTPHSARTYARIIYMRALLAPQPLRTRPPHTAPHISKLAPRQLDSMGARRRLSLSQLYKSRLTHSAL